MREREEGRPQVREREEGRPQVRECILACVCAFRVSAGGGGGGEGQRSYTTLRRVPAGVEGREGGEGGVEGREGCVQRP